MVLCRRTQTGRLGDACDAHPVVQLAQLHRSADRWVTTTDLSVSETCFHEDNKHAKCDLIRAVVPSFGGAEGEAAADPLEVHHPQPLAASPASVWHWLLSSYYKQSPVVFKWLAICFYGDSILHCYDRAIFIPINKVPPTLTGCFYRFFFLWPTCFQIAWIFESAVLWLSDGLLFHAVIKSQLRAAHVRLWYHSINRRVIRFPAATRETGRLFCFLGRSDDHVPHPCFCWHKTSWPSLICNHSLCPIHCFHCKRTPYVLSSVLSLAIHLLPLFFFIIPSSHYRPTSSFKDTNWFFKYTIFPRLKYLGQPLEVALLAQLPRKEGFFLLLL